MITVKTASFFICVYAYEKTQEDGTEKKVKEQYVVDALSFTEAEARIIENMQPYVHGETDVADISKAPFGEIFFTDDEKADKYYKVKASFIIIDENTGREKREPHYYLVQGTSTQNAQHNFDEGMGKTMIDYEVGAVVETKIMDVFLHIPAKI